MAKEILISESATKKQQEVAKLLWGAKGKTLIANFDVLNKLKKKLGQEENSLLNTIAQFLKSDLDEKTVVKLKKRKGFDTLPARLKAVAVKLKKLQPLRDKHDAAMKGMPAFTKLFATEREKMISQSSTKSQQETAKALWGAKGKTVVAAMDALNKVKRKLGEDEINLVTNLTSFLRVAFDERTITRLKKRKGFDTLGARLKALTSNLPKLLSAQDAYKKDLKEVMKFNVVLGKAIDTGAANTVAKTSDKAAQTAAKKVLSKRKPADKAIKGKGKKKSPALSEKQMNANYELAQGMTIARAIGFENGEFILDAMKKAGMKKPESYNGAGKTAAAKTVQFTSKDDVQKVAVKFLKQLKKNVDTSSSLMHIEHYRPKDHVVLSTYVGSKTRAVHIRDIAGQKTIYVEQETTVSNVVFDGSKYFITPAAANIFNAVSLSLKAGGRAPSKVKQDKADLKVLNVLKEGMSLGMTVANIRNKIGKMSIGLQQDLLNELPELGEI